MFRALLGFGRKNRSPQRRVPAPKAVQPRRWQPLLEELEARFAPSVDIFATPDGVIHANCGDAPENDVQVQHVAGETVIYDLGPGGTYHSFPDSGHYTRVEILGGGLLTSTGISSTILPVHVFGHSHDRVDVGNGSHSVQAIQAPLYFENQPSWNTIYVHDQGDPRNPTVTLDTTVLSGDEWGRISGLAPQHIYFKYGDTEGVNIYTGDSTVNVQSTFPISNAGAVTLFGNAVNTTVNVGYPGRLQDIQGELRVDNATKLIVNGVGNHDSYTVTLDSFTDNWGRITGLTPASILYKASNVTLQTDYSGGAFKVERTYASSPVTLILSSGSLNDSVFVGKNGSVENVEGILTIEGFSLGTAITIDNRAFNGPRQTVTLDTTDGPYGTYGQITGLVPFISQTIKFKHDGTRSLVIHTGQNGADVNVLRTGSLANNASITLIGHHNGDTVTVGNAQSVQEIKGSLMVENASGKTQLTVDDSADSGFQSATLDTDPFGVFSQISGLTPASATISYRRSQVSELDMMTGLGGAHIDVQDSGVPTVLYGNSSSSNDKVCVEATSASLAINVSANETVQLGNSANRLNGITANTVTLNGDGTTTLNVVDRGSTYPGNTYTVSDNQLTSGELGVIVSYTGLQKLNLWRGSPSTVNDLTPFPWAEDRFDDPPPC